jgi:Ca2+-binding RTX toxin-like protein
MLALLFLPALLGLALVVHLTDDHDEVELPPEPAPPTETPANPAPVDPANPAPVDEVFATPPPAGSFDTAPSAPAPQPTSAGVTLEADRDPVRLSGTGGGDTINTTDEATSIRGNAGNDLLLGGDNDENIDGGRGMDTIVAGRGNDTFSGGRGNDLIYPGDGNDRSAGVVAQDPGDDTVYGGAGNDFIRNSAGSNLIFGEAGNDRVSSVSDFRGTEASDPDTLIGGAGNDTLTGEAGDLMYGGSDQDLFTVFDKVPASTVIVDFNINDDRLVIIVPAGLSEPLEFTHDAVQNGVAVSESDEIIAFLHGITANQIGALQTGTSMVLDGRLGTAA